MKKPVSQVEQKKPVNPASPKKPKKKSAKKGSSLSKTERFQTVWVGLDKDYMRPDLQWFRILIQNSNLRFLGAYVSGAIPSTAQDLKENEFTGVSQRSDNGWMENIKDLSAMGWGIVFFYVGYSDAEQVLKDGKWIDEPKKVVWLPGAKEVPLIRERGILHGKHIREIVKRHLGDSWAGAVVMIDNENTLGGQTPDGEAYNDYSNRLKEYYRGIFDELERPDGDLPALRPGLYGKLALAPVLLASKPDLFIWDPRYYTQNSSAAPYKPDNDPIKLVIDKHKELYSLRIKERSEKEWTMWPLGRQYQAYGGSLPIKDSKTVKRLKSEQTIWKPFKVWDFNTSFVRNPAFPIAEPRIAARALGRGSGVVLLRGTHRMPDSNDEAPYMRIEELSYSSRDLIPSDSKNRVEPEAPLIITRRRKQFFLLTVLHDGRLAEAIRNEEGRWSAIRLIDGGQPTLRRLRSLCVAPRLDEDRTDADQQAFFVGQDNRIHHMVRTQVNGWSYSGIVEKMLRVHPFSGLCAADRGEGNIDIFFIDEQGLLSRAYSTTSSPNFQIQRLEKKASLLKGGVLGCAMLSSDKLMVVGIGVDLRLWFASFSTGAGWSELAAIGQPENRVGPHSRFVLYAVDGGDSAVIFSLSPAGELLTFDMERNGIKWSLAEHKVIPGPPRTIDKSSQNGATGFISDAQGWNINPLGDIVFVGDDVFEIYCAGLKQDQQQVLEHRLTDTATWQYYPT